MREDLFTERLVLRDIRVRDAEWLRQLDSDPEVMRYIGSAPVPELEAIRERIRSVYLAWQSHPWHGIRVVGDRASEERLGWVFIRPAHLSGMAEQLGWRRADEVEIGYRFCRSAWGQGMATEAARPLIEIALADPETAAVVACAQAGNLGSIRVLQKLGLSEVGRLEPPRTEQSTVLFASPSKLHNPAAAV